MAKYLGHLYNGKNLTILTDTVTHTVPKTHMNFDRIMNALDKGDYNTAVQLADVASTINKYSAGKVVVKEGVVFYNGLPLHNSLTDRMVRMIREGKPINALANFLDRLMKNPSSRAVNELYRFLEANDLPVTPDGYFLAYKNVGHDYYDKHSHKFRNMEGDVCQMPRNEVMDDPNQTCAAGLHFCSIEYLRGFWGTGGHTMVVRIDPADVVSIPVDYNNSKGRCCRYQVVAEHFGNTQDSLSEDSVYVTEEYREFFDGPTDELAIYWNGYDDGYDDGWTDCDKYS